MRLSWPNILTSKEKPQSTEASKIEKHWGTIVSLIGIFLLALFIRSYFAFDLATKFGAPYLLSGGSDAYYYQRIIDYIQSNHHHMLTDPLRKYPLGGLNPRPPLLAWTSVLTGYAISPFVGDVSEAISYSFIFSAGIWGALTVFPAYLIGRDTFGKKAGIAGALMLAISSGHLQRSVITNGDHDALYLFFAVTAFYFFMKALESIPEDINWVSDWSDPDEIKKGLINFASKNKVSLLNAAMAGMSTAAVALTWKGFPYVMVIILVYFFFQLIVNKLQVKDSLGITSVVGVSMGMTFLVAGPYYIGTGFGSNLPSGIGKWYDVPLIIFLAAFLIGVFFTVTRDVPWLLVFSSFFTAIALFFALGSVFFPGLIDTLMGGAGYFVQNKLYSTIAEAQAPQFSNLVLSFGLVSFFLSITGLIFAIWHLKSDLRPNFMFILIWTGFAIYMAVTAARFIFNSSPAFALLAGWVLALAVDKVDFPGIYQRFRVYRGDMFRGIYEGVKLKHIMVALLVVFLVVMPNTLYAFDAGIPYEEKIEYDNDIYETLPKAIRPEGHDPDSDNNWYLGAFGYSMDKPTGYWPAAWDWFSEQDSELPPEERPAFVSWWDYGFEAMQEGQHPTVADNFQQGYRIAGNILMAQNESETIALFIARELELPYSKDGGFEGRVRDILVEHIGEDKTAELEDVYRNPAAYKEEVLSNPKRYHPRAEDIHPRNVWCAKVMGLLSYEGVDTLSELYRDVSLHLDKRIKYLAVDSRLFPTSGTQTGIFYAPAKLSGHRIDESEGMRTPVDFFDILLAGDDGNSYEDPDNIPQGVSITNYKIDFKPMFYNTTLYRTFAGYSADEVDKGKGGNGIPGLGEQNQIMPMPSWNMSHFRMTYKTAYYNPYPQDEVRNHSDAWRAVSFETASKYQEQEKGTVDMSPRSYMNQGVVFLEYFDGAIVSGNVETENGDPIEDATITVLDESGTPHQTRKTDGDGYYKVKVPFGNISVIASNGGISGGNKIIKTEAIQLGSVSLNVTKDEAMRKKVDKNVDGKWDYLYDRDITVSSSDLTVNVFIDQDQDGSYNQANDTLVSSEVTVVNEDSGVEYDSGMTNGTYTFENLVPGTYKISSDAEGTEELTGVKVEPGEDISEGVMVTTGSISGGIESEVENGEETFDIKIEREDTDYNATTTVEAGDNYTFEDLVPGTYYIDIDNDSYTVDGGPYYFDIGDEDEKEHNITVIDSTVVEGKTIYSSKKLPYQRLTFEGGSGVNYSRVIRTDEDGEFRIKLPLGKFIVNGVYQRDGEKYVHVGSLIVPFDDPYRATFEPSYKVSGRIFSDSAPEEDIRLLFTNNDDKEAVVRTNSEGNFSLSLPPDDYSLYGWKIEGVTPLYVWEDVSVESSVYNEYDTEKGSFVSGTVYRDLNRNGKYDPGEGIQSGYDMVYETKSTSFSTSYDGRFSSIVPKENIDITFTREGFKTSTIEYSPELGNYNQDVSLEADNVTLKGDIDYNTEAQELDEIPLEFVSLGQSAIGKDIVVEGTSFTTELQPGDYNIVIDHIEEDGKVKYEFDEDLMVGIGEEEINLDIDVDYKVRFSGDLYAESGNLTSGTLFFQKETFLDNVSTEGSFETYLTPDVYSIRAVNEKITESNQIKRDIEEPTELNITLERSSEFTPSVTYDGLPKENVPVVVNNRDSGFTFNKTTDPNGEVQFNLNPGEYRVSVDHTIQDSVPNIGVPKTVNYYYSRLFSINGSTSPVIQLESELVNNTLSGRVLIGDSGARETEVNFISTGPGSLSKTVRTDSNGRFETELLGGTGSYYTIYSYYEGSEGLYAEVHDFFMPREDDTLNISLSPAVKISGRVTVDGDGKETEVEFSRTDVGVGSKSFETDSDGSYEAILPKGSYSVKSSWKKTEGDDQIEYQKNKEVELSYNRVLDLELEKVKEYGVSISSVKTRKADPGDNLTYSISITNTGNTEDEFKLDAKKSVWDIDLEPASFKLKAGRSKTIKAVVHVSEEASVDHPPISFTVKYGDSQEKDKELPIDVKQRYGLEIDEEVTKKSFESGYLKYTVKVTNTGNGDDTFTLNIKNQESLKLKGWEVDLKNSTELISEGKSEEVVIELKAMTSDPNRNAKINLIGTSQGDQSITYETSFDIEVPSVKAEGDSVDVAGDKISLEKEEFNLKTWHWGSLVFLAIIAAVYILRKKRWI